jgi:hypothetical protein
LPNNSQQTLIGTAGIPPAVSELDLEGNEGETPASAFATGEVLAVPANDILDYSHLNYIFVVLISIPYADVLWR